MEELKLLLSLSAFGIGLWNIQRLNNLDSKVEYKDKRYLYQECLDEAKTLIEKINMSLAKIEGLRDELGVINSPYANSVGGKGGHNCLIKGLTFINEEKECVIELYQSLNAVIKLGDKDSFDRCIQIRKDLKDSFLKVSPKLYQTENLMNRMILFANEQRS